MPPGFEHSDAPEQPAAPRENSRRRGPNDFATRAVDVVRNFLNGSGLNVDSFRGMQGQTGGRLERFAGWIRDNGFDRNTRRGRNVVRGRRGRRGVERGVDRGSDSGSAGLENTRGMISPEDLSVRVTALQGKFPGSFESMKFPLGDPQALTNWLLKRSINPGEYLEWIAKLERTADRMVAETVQRPGWENPELWIRHVQFDGMRFWAFNQAKGETCIATAGQLLFAGGNPEQIRTHLRSVSPTLQVQSLQRDSVQWDITAMGQRFTTAGGRRKIYSSNNDGDTVEISNGGRTQSVTHFGETVVSRVNGTGAPVAQSASLDDASVHKGLPEGTHIRTPSGEWLGNAAREIQKRGFNGYVRKLAQLPVREMAAYLSSIFNDQHEDVYAVRNSTQALAFYRDNLTFEQSIRSGKADCREIAKLSEMALRLKSPPVRCATVRIGKDHAALAWIEPSGNPQFPYVCRTIENTGFQDQYKPGRTPGEALMNAREEDYRAGHAEIFNDKMRMGTTSYDRVAASIINVQAPM